MIGHPRTRARRVREAALRPIRRHYYMTGAGHALVRRLPAATRGALGLEDETAVGTRRLEIGGGKSPRPGYLHVEVDPSANHVEIVRPAWSLPFPDGWAEEIVAVHVLEHITPNLLAATLREWHRVLGPAGALQVHVPNGPELMTAYLRGDESAKWRAGAALLGMGASPSISGPSGLASRADHQSIFDSATLEGLLASAGFSKIQNLTGQVSDHHTEAWRSLVPHCSLIFRGVRT